MKRYGAWQPHRLQGLLGDIFSPLVTNSMEQVLYSLIELRESPLTLMSFRDALRAMLLDSSERWGEKLNYYLMFHAPTEDHAQRWFRWVWEILFPDEPWMFPDNGYERRHPELIGKRPDHNADPKE